MNVQQDAVSAGQIHRLTSGTDNSSDATPITRPELEEAIKALCQGGTVSSAPDSESMRQLMQRFEQLDPEGVRRAEAQLERQGIFSHRFIFSFLRKGTMVGAFPYFLYNLQGFAQLLLGPAFASGSLPEGSTTMEALLSVSKAFENSLCEYPAATFGFAAALFNFTAQNWDSIQWNTFAHTFLIAILPYDLTPMTLLTAVLVANLSGTTSVRTAVKTATMAIDRGLKGVGEGIKATGTFLERLFGGKNSLTT